MTDPTSPQPATVAVAESPWPPSSFGLRARAWLRRTHDPLEGLYLTIPVFLIYHLGLPFVSMRNACDVLSTGMFKLIEYNVAAYCLLTVAMAAAIGVCVFLMRRTMGMRTLGWRSLLAESALFALIMPAIAAWFTSSIVGYSLAPGALGAFDKLVLSAGAGFHEELIFRVLFFGALVVGIRRTGMSKTGSVLVAAAFSALLFSASHHLGPYGDPFTLDAFTFRAMGGFVLALLYWWRGFAVVVYTHMFYDLYVFFLF